MHQVKLLLEIRHVVCYTMLYVEIDSHGKIYRFFFFNNLLIQVEKGEMLVMEDQTSLKENGAVITIFWRVVLF